ncbi:MAG TPA: GNVR domain-containing protein, partial [Geminicoccaceae bacterium]
AVAYRSSDPEKAARVANALAELYLAAQTERKQAAARRAGGWLAEQRELVRGQLEHAQADLAAFQDRDGKERGGGALAVERDEIADLNRQLVLAGADRSAREARLGQLRVGAAAGEATTADGGSPLLQNLSAMKAELLRREAELAGQYGERHPRLVDIRGEKAELDARIGEERQGLLRGIQGELDAARARERALGRALDELKGRAVRQGDSSREAAALEGEVDLNRRLYESLLERASTAATSAATPEPDARVISEAVPPPAPTFPKPRLISSLGATLGLGLGLLLVYLLESRDRGFRSAREIQAELGLPTVALIPELGRSSPGGGGGTRRGSDPPIEPSAYALERPRSRYAEALREILASLLTGPVGPAGPAKVVLLTSIVPDEGKSTLTLSLGRLAASEGLRVLAIDADLRRPSLHALAGLKPGPGIVELLKGEAPLDEVMRADPRSELKILAGSGRLSQPTRLFTPEKVGRLLAAVRGTFDLVLVDAAPLAAVADPRLLAPLVDRTFLIVRYGSTRRELCAHCLGMLRATGAQLGGVVLSRVDLRRHRESGAADAGFAYARLAHYYAD